MSAFGGEERQADPAPPGKRRQPRLLVDEPHRHLGPGFLEKTYEDALAIELRLRGIRFERQVPLAVHYKDLAVTGCVLDFLVEDAVVVELQAVEQVLEVHRAQVLAYLKAGRFRLGLLINFNVPTLRNGIARVAL
jgi:GxxExxY protein